MVVAKNMEAATPIAVRIVGYDYQSGPTPAIMTQSVPFVRTIQLFQTMPAIIHGGMQEDLTSLAVTGMWIQRLVIVTGSP
jgi:hypothetical protein